MNRLRVLLVALLLAVSLTAVPMSGAGIEPGTSGTVVTENVGSAEPSPDESIGAVEGVRYDDSLPADDREDATLSADELEDVVHRSMARVEVIREQSFEEVPYVAVISRAEFEAENEELLVVDTEADALLENVRHEASFLVDRETNATDAVEELYGGSVGGYYDPATDEIVLVSDSPDEPELDEVTLGHELHHALQDQRFDLARYEMETREERNAKTGLIEGEAVWIDAEYEARCEAEWDCVLPESDAGEPPTSFNRGLFFTVFHPYSDGPAYVDHLLGEGGWDAVDAAYDEPPASSSEVIRPDRSREPVEIDLEDRSNERWEPITVEGGPDRATLGEAAMASMFMHRALDGDESVLETGDVFDSEESLYNYDHDVTDGWAGDELLAYATDAETTDESGFVWESRWISDDDAGEFLDGYRALIEAEGGEAVDGLESTYEIDDESGFPGAYSLERDDETVTIVRAPSVGELDELRDGAGPDASDGVSSEGDVSDGDDGADSSVSVGLPVFVLALATGASLVVLIARRRR